MGRETLKYTLRESINMLIKIVLIYRMHASTKKVIMVWYDNTTVPLQAYNVMCMVYIISQGMFS